MNKVLRGILLSLPAFLCSASGSVFMFVFWFRNVPLGVLNLTQTLLVAIACYVTALVYLCTLGYCYSVGRCRGNREEEIQPLELIEEQTTDDE